MRKQFFNKCLETTILSRQTSTTYDKNILQSLCFAIKDGDEYFMVDAGGGNGILRILEDMDVDLCHIHNIFVTHEHTDHIMGIVWMVRMVAAAMKKGKYEGELQIYCHQGLVDTISTICRLTIQGKFYKMIGSRIFLVPVEDGETVHILDYDVTFLRLWSLRLHP